MTADVISMKLFRKEALAESLDLPTPPERDALNLAIRCSDTMRETYIIRSRHVLGDLGAEVMTLLDRDGPGVWHELLLAELEVARLRKDIENAKR